MQNNRTARFVVFMLALAAIAALLILEARQLRALRRIETIARADAVLLPSIVEPSHSWGVDEQGRQTLTLRGMRAGERATFSPSTGEVSRSEIPSESDE